MCNLFSIFVGIMLLPLTVGAKEINSTKFNAGYISNMFTKGNNVYMLLDYKQRKNIPN